NIDEILGTRAVRSIAFALHTQPQLEIHELPEEHHVILLRPPALHDRFMLVEQALDFPHVVHPALAKALRPDDIAERHTAFAAEPDVRRRIPPRLLYPRPRLFGHDAPH